MHSPTSETGCPKLDKRNLEQSSSGSEDCHKHPSILWPPLFVSIPGCDKCTGTRAFWLLMQSRSLCFTPCRCLWISPSTNPEKMMPLCCTRGQPVPGGTWESFQWKRKPESSKRVIWAGQLESSCRVTQKSHKRKGVLYKTLETFDRLRRNSFAHLFWLAFFI